MSTRSKHSGQPPSGKYSFYEHEFITVSFYVIGSDNQYMHEIVLCHRGILSNISQSTVLIIQCYELPKKEQRMHELTSIK